MNIFLDDIRVPNMSHNGEKGLGIEYSNEDKWIIVRDYFEFIKIIDENIKDIKFISFDHDLACYKDGREYTGKDAADYLIDKCMDNSIELPDWFVHSDNICGKPNMIGAFLNYMRVIEKIDISKFRYYHSGVFEGNFI